jgi:hypothetical protein
VGTLGGTNLVEGNTMANSDSTIQMNREDVLKCVDILDILVVSLHRMGSSLPGLSDLDESQRLGIIEGFLVEWRVLPLLSEARRTLSVEFNDQSLEDEQTELERELPPRRYWSLRDQSPPIEFLEKHLK